MGGRGSGSRISRAGAPGAFESGPVPSEDQIKMGDALYAGMAVVYDNSMDADARNHDTYVAVSDKFFSHDPETQRSILNHEVAHSISDDMIASHTSDFGQFSNAFVQEKPVPHGSSAWERGQRTYKEGIYGDIGATALVETTTRAITEYLSDPNSLKRKSQSAYRYVNDFMKRR